MRALVATGLMLGALPGAAVANAQVRVWDGAPDSGGLSVDDRWSTGTNWVGDVAPVDGDAISIPAATRLVSYNDLSATFSSVTFTSFHHLVGGVIHVAGSLSAQSGSTISVEAVVLHGATTIDSDGTMSIQSMSADAHQVRFEGSSDLSVTGFTVEAGAPAVLAAMGSAGRLGVGTTALGTLRVLSGTATGSWPGAVLLDGGTFVAGRAGSVTTVSRGTLVTTYATTIGSVQLNGASTVSLYTGASIAKNIGATKIGRLDLGGAHLEVPQFVGHANETRLAIDVTGPDPVHGTFAGLPEEGRQLLGGIPGQITYTGLDGNDILLTVVGSINHRSGYWMLDGAKNVYPFGDAQSNGPAGLDGLPVGITPHPDYNGYWTVAADGQVATSGGRFYGDRPPLKPGETVTSLAGLPIGNGYWLFTSKGRAFPYNGAQWYNDLEFTSLNGPVLGSFATPSGEGYYMAAFDGGLFAFGDAAFHGSMGATRLNAPVVGMAPDPDGSGYWLVAADGGIFAFEAPFRGSMGGRHLNRPVTGMVPYGNGYLLVATDGGIFNFSDKPFSGSLGANPPATPVIAVAALND